jgi:LacI family transcriptional regulator
MKDRTIRIKDIALKARVSTGTVDRVLHNRGKVSARVKEKVLEIIKEMHYEPNLMARALGSKKKYNIAVLIPDETYDPYWTVPRTGIASAEQDLKQFGVVVHDFLFNPASVSSFVEKATAASLTMPDGILLSPVFYREALPFFKQWKAKAIPFVLINTQIAAAEPLSYIGQDSYQSGYLAAKLIQYGQPEACTILIAHFDEEFANAAHLEKKEQGFRDYFSQNKLHQYTLIKADLNSSNETFFVKQMDAVFEGASDLKSIFVSTSKAYKLAAYLKEREINQVKIIGYDLLSKNLYFLENNYIHFLINQNPKGQGYWGLSLLADHLVFKKEVPVLKYLPLDVVTKENASYFTENEMGLRK